MGKIRWHEDEVILLLDLYFRLRTSSKISKNNEDVIMLSTLLNRRADLLNITHDEKFRNTNGIVMQLQNIEYVITNGKSGIANVGTLQRQVTERYKDARVMLHRQADALTEAINSRTYWVR